MCLLWKSWLRKRPMKVIKTNSFAFLATQCKMHEFVSVQAKLVNGSGQRNTVVIKNGKATKTVEKIKNGNVKQKKTRKLSPSERKQILAGQFVPGLWRNCKFGRCLTRRNRA